jgi:tetratricopeptide (TPR) repeat protein
VSRALLPSPLAVAAFFVLLTGPARALDTVVVAPFALSGTSGPTDGAEYRFIGGALADMLSHRLLASGVAQVFSQGQWEAVLRERDIAPSQIGDVDAARAVAAKLGADQFVVGSYRAAWPYIDVVARRFKTTDDAPIATATVALTLDALVDVEKKVAAALFTGPLQKAATIAPLTKDMLAWRHLALCKEALVVQSMGPRASVWAPPALAQSARADCEAALNRDKSLVDARAWIALARYIDGEQKEALALALDVVKQRKNAGWSDLIAAFLTRLEGDEPRARQILVDAAKKAPGNLHIRSTLGEYQLESGAVDDAERTYRAILVDVPRGPWFKAQLGKVLARRGQHDLAIAATDEAVALVPDDAIVLLEKASREIDAKRFDAAEKTLRKALEKDPRIAALYLRLGYVYLETGNNMLARPILKKALYEADRESERRVRGYAHFDLAKLSAREGDVDAALFELSKAIGAGFRDRARIESDTDLATVRSAPAYSKVMEAMQ